MGATSCSECGAGLEPAALTCRLCGAEARPARPKSPRPTDVERYQSDVRSLREQLRRMREARPA
jgi:ribosomal protein L40E